VAPSEGTQLSLINARSLFLMDGGGDRKDWGALEGVAPHHPTNSPTPYADHT